MRIQKYLSQKGILSRRETEAYIRNRRIRLNGNVVETMGVQMDPSKDKVEVLGAHTKETVQKITVLVYKPRGVVCSKQSAEGRTVFQVFPKFANLNAVGRLDKESEGLLLLSNDGVVTAVVTGDDHLVEKEYEVTVREDISRWHMKKMAEGILLNGVKTLPAKTKLVSDHTFSLIISEGKTHQIRRMADALHLTIERLIRIRIGNLTFHGLTSGKSRVVSPDEIAALKRLKKRN